MGLGLKVYWGLQVYDDWMQINGIACWVWGLGLVGSLGFGMADSISDL